MTSTSLNLPSGDGGMFGLLPEEVMHYLYKYNDIPSLASMAQTGKNQAALYASDDETWKVLVQLRFRIPTTARMRPKVYGGRTWKEAYRSMAHCQRVPRCRFTSSRKTVFAKGRTKQKNESCINMWVFLAHTEDCKTRTIRRNTMNLGDSAEEESMIRQRQSERYVELHLCMQNVKSGGNDVVTNVMESALVLMGNGSNFDPLTSPVHQSRTLAPKLLFHDAMKDTNEDLKMAPSERDTFDIANGVTLRPFELVVISVRFPCTTDVYETDFLARAVSLHVPIYEPPTNDQKIHVIPSVISDETTWASLRETVQPHASAFFLPEKDIWEVYEQLPGGCLTLVDKTHAFTL